MQVVPWLRRREIGSTQHREIVRFLVLSCDDDDSRYVRKILTIIADVIMDQSDLGKLLFDEVSLYLHESVVGLPSGTHMYVQLKELAEKNDLEESELNKKFERMAKLYFIAYM